MLVGHQKQWDFLRKSAELDKLSHAILFSGQNKIGKRTLALEFVKFLNCNSSQAPCQKCRSCLDIENKRYPDLVFIKPEDKTASIQISQIRNLITKLSLKPYSASLKVGLIDKAHTMTREAQSCFLKLLEEPKGKTLLILITEYPEAILPTIISRVQTLRFSPVKKEEIRKYLQKRGVSQQKAKELSSVSLGKPGLALDFLKNPEKLEERNQAVSDLLKLKDLNFSSRFTYAKNLSVSAGGVEQVLNVWLDYLRRILVLKTEKKDFISSFKDYPFLKLKKFVEKIQSTLFLFSTTNVNPKLAIENLLIEL